MMKTTYDSNGQFHDHAGGGDSRNDITGDEGANVKNYTSTQAVHFLNLMKQTFQNQPEKYETFQEIMRAFQGIGFVGIGEKMKELLEGHRDLISRFNEFLPEAYEITPDDEDEAPTKKGVNHEDARALVCKIKEQFQDDDPHVYLSFMDILHRYRSNVMDITEVYMEVSSLFGNHPDLLEEFNRFMPDDSNAHIQHTPYGQDLAQWFNEYSSATTIKQRSHLDKELLQRDKLISSHDDNLSIHSSELDGGKAMIKKHKRHKNQVEEIRDRRVHDQNEREPDLSNNRSLECVPAKKTSVMKAEVLRHSAEVPFGMFGQTRSFNHKVKEKLSSSDLQSFYTYVEEYKSGLINSYDLDNKVTTSTREFPDLMSEYKDITRQGKYIPSCNFIQKVQERLGSSDDLEAFLKGFAMNRRKLDTHCLNDFVATFIGEFPDLMEEYNQFVDQDQLQRSQKLEDGGRNQECEMLGSQERKGLFECDVGFEEDGPPTPNVFESEKESKEKHDKYMKLDFNDCERCNVSYRHLPEDYPIIIPSRRRPLDTQVLNDQWMSVASGKEDSFKHWRLNSYQETLFQCEEDQFEVDALIARVESTAKHAKEFYNYIEGNKINRKDPNNMETNEINKKDPTKMETYLSVLHLKCIEKLYDDQGLEMIELLREHPGVVLPVILKRLKQKMEACREYRSGKKKFWAKAYADNHDKSLDHRSLNFRQQDLNNMKPKALMAEIKGIKEKLPNQEWLQVSAAGYKLSPIPHMQFEYSDADIHEDLYKLVCYASKEIVGKKCLLNKMLQIWTTFLEPMLGVHSQLAAADNRRDGSKNVDCDAKASVAKSQRGNVSREEHCDMATPDSLANRVLIQSNNQEEKEEGEITPSLDGDYDDDAAFEGGEELSSREFFQEEHEGQGYKEYDDIVDKAMCNTQSATDGSLLESSFLSAKPLSKHILPVSQEEGRESRIIYGNDDFYVLFRLHQIFYERILSAKTNSMKSEVKLRVAEKANSPDPYSRFMNALYNFIGGSVNKETFEGECQAIFGNQSYLLLTLNHLIHKLVKQLRVVANDEINDQILQLFEYENSQKPENLTHLAYLGNARMILPGENVYRFECSSGPSKLFIWLTDRTNERPTAIDSNDVDYLHNDFLSVSPDIVEPRGIIQQRNKRKHGGSDEFPDMEGVTIINRIDHVKVCDSFKMQYAPFEEDVLYRRRKKRKTSSEDNKAREERFHRFLSKKLSCEKQTDTKVAA